MGDETKCWRFTVDGLPPGVNHQYAPIGVQGKKALTREAVAQRMAFTLAARRTGFEPSLKGTYAVSVVFTMPGWSQDIDGPVKALLDSIFVAPGRRFAWDHRIVDLHVTKRVKHGCYQTDVTIYEVATA